MHKQLEGLMTDLPLPIYSENKCDHSIPTYPPAQPRPQRKCALYIKIPNKCVSNLGDNL